MCRRTSAAGSGPRRSPDPQCGRTHTATLHDHGRGAGASHRRRGGGVREPRFFLHDAAEIQNLLRGAGFHDVAIQSDTKPLRVPAPEEFLWQYVHSTALAGAVAQVDDKRHGSLERDVVAKWPEYVEGRATALHVRVVVGTARK